MTPLINGHGTFNHRLFYRFGAPACPFHPRRAIRVGERTVAAAATAETGVLHIWIILMIYLAVHSRYLYLLVKLRKVLLKPVPSVFVVIQKTDRRICPDAFSVGNVSPRINFVKIGGKCAFSQHGRELYGTDARHKDVNDNERKYD